MKSERCHFMFYGVVREKVNSCVCGGRFSVHVNFETCCFRVIVKPRKLMELGLSVWD